jgi:hypothetical protein
MVGTKHLIECHCILPQYRNKKDPTYHKFVVFSVIDDNDVVVPKLAECNNCGVLHKVIDLCKSEIAIGKDETNAVTKKEDFKLSLPPELYQLLNDYECNIADYEMAQFVLDNKKWDSHIVLTREKLDENVQGKLIKFLEEGKMRVESYIQKKAIRNEKN